MRSRHFLYACSLLMVPVGPAALAEPVALSDAQLGQLTAGSAQAQGGSGGAIVTGGSTATLSTGAAVALSDTAQEGARGLNVVTGADSAVANGVNVWDGRSANGHQLSDGPELQVDQFNEVTQVAAVGAQANLQHYDRSESNEFVSTDATGSFTANATRTVTNDSMVDTTQELNFSDSVKPQLKAGQGIAGTGELEIDVDAGEVLLNVGAEAKASVTGEIETTGLLGRTTGASTTASVESKVTGDLSWELPKLGLSFDGSICFVALGQCKAVGTDASTSSSTGDRTEDITTTTYAPVSIASANAEYIVVDQATLDVRTDHSVTLSGAAQQNARALNLVNAAGSRITNGVNVSRTADIRSNLSLRQHNLITQLR
jgi:hypothetical protein